MDVHFPLARINEVAVRFLEAIGERKVVALHGEMGAGKTTFVHAVCNALGVKSSVTSPTFSIINEYKTNAGKSVFHIDLYRLKNELDAINAGVEDCLYSEELCFVEWPEKTPNLFPPQTVHCFISLSNGGERRLLIAEVNDK